MDILCFYLLVVMMMLFFLFFLILFFLYINKDIKLMFAFVLYKVLKELFFLIEMGKVKFSGFLSLGGNLFCNFVLFFFISVTVLNYESFFFLMLRFLNILYNFESVLSRLWTSYWCGVCLVYSEIF